LLVRNQRLVVGSLGAGDGKFTFACPAQADSAMSDRLQRVDVTGKITRIHAIMESQMLAVDSQKLQVARDYSARSRRKV
jgi:hypothetical protein